MYDERMSQLTIVDHDRDRAGRRYVYPVVSRRAGGLSVGVNLNPNNACNWRCIYCQVPGLVRGKGPLIDVAVLEDELGDLLEQVVHGDFLPVNVPEAFRRLNDIALAGNGEPTTSAQLRPVMDCIERQLRQFDLLGVVKVVMITNGSMTHRPDVQDAVRKLATMNGELWFKLDRATPEGMAKVNSVGGSPEVHIDRLRAVAALIPTYIQTCLFALDGDPPSAEELGAYVAAVAGLVEDRVPLRGVQLYGIARPSHQPEAPRLRPLPIEWLEAFAERVRALGIPVHVNA